MKERTHLEQRRISSLSHSFSRLAFIVYPISLSDLPQFRFSIRDGARRKKAQGEAHYGDGLVTFGTENGSESTSPLRKLHESRVNLHEDKRRGQQFPQDSRRKERENRQQ